MPPKLARKIVRENTAYHAGRQAVDILLFLNALISMLGEIFTIFLIYKMESINVRDTSTAYTIAVAFVLLLNLVSVVAIREFIHSIFDMADCALKRGNKTGNTLEEIAEAVGV